MGFLKDTRAMRKTATVLNDMRDQNATSRRLMATGRQGTARVTAIRDTGLTVNENPQVELDLEVSVDGAAPYAVTHRQVVSRVAVPAFQPGATVPVRIDPADPQTLLVA